jgi:hypothetical protein
VSREEAIALQLGFAYLEAALTTAAYVRSLVTLADMANNHTVTVRIRVRDDGTLEIVNAPDPEDRPPVRETRHDAVIDGGEE